MRAFIVVVFVAVGIVLSAGRAVAQGQVVAPAAGCTATPAQLEANKKVAMAFFAPNADRVALVDPSYKQHNPAFVKGGKEAGLSDFEYFKSRFGGPRQGGPGGGAGRGQAPAAAGPQPPAGNPLEIVMAECDLVTIIHKNHRQDPTAAAGVGDLLRGVLVRHLPRPQRQAGRALGWCGDQSASGRNAGAGARRTIACLLSAAPVSVRTKSSRRFEEAARRCRESQHADRRLDQLDEAAEIA
jgi:hypothetical protein